MKLAQRKGDALRDPKLHSAVEDRKAAIFLFLSYTALRPGSLFGLGRAGFRRSWCHFRSVLNGRESEAVEGSEGGPDPKGRSQPW